MIISCIVAVAENGVIGKGNELPWHLPADLKRFKDITWGHPIVMGRKTYASIGRCLPGRTTIVMTRHAENAVEGARMATSLDEALEHAGDSDGGEEIFIVGGHDIFRLALPRADRLYITQVHAEVDGDVYFPEGALDGWTCKRDEPHARDERHPYAFSFRVYERR